VAGTRPRAPSARPPRRLPRGARRAQLVAAATPVAALQGLSDFSLDEVALRADVTRNLLYHYFPRGRPDLTLAVVEEAGRVLTDGWVIDEAIPLPERLAMNVGRLVDHAMQPSDAWRLYRLARVTTDPEVRGVFDRFVDLVLASISLNQLGTAAPPPLARAALVGFFAFFEATLEEARAAALPRERVLAMLNKTLVAALGASDV
jgi:AcrR family transcriptional regulator